MEISPQPDGAAVGSWPDGTPIATETPTATANLGGRPTDYSFDLAIEICERLGNDEKLHDICKLEHMPCAATVYRWLARETEFQLAYNCALMAKFDKRSEELIKIADDADRDNAEVKGDDGIATVKPVKESVARTETRLNIRKWIMAKELPRKYAEIQPLTIAAPVEVNAPRGIEDQTQPRRSITLAEAVELYERETAKNR